MASSERKTIDDGYKFTGIYSFDRDEAKEEAKKERQKGYLARIVYTPGGGGGCCGYSVYKKPNKKKAAKINVVNKMLESLQKVKNEFIEKIKIQREYDEDKIDIINKQIRYLKDSI
jgi:hypothetical protein